jgi:hypothetical protein
VQTGIAEGVPRRGGRSPQEAAGKIIAIARELESVKV